MPKETVITFNGFQVRFNADKVAVYRHHDEKIWTVVLQDVYFYRLVQPEAKASGQTRKVIDQ